MLVIYVFVKNKDTLPILTPGVAADDDAMCASLGWKVGASSALWMAQLHGSADLCRMLPWTRAQLYGYQQHKLGLCLWSGSLSLDWLSGSDWRSPGSGTGPWDAHRGSKALEDGDGWRD